MTMEEISKFLSTHSGRDKVIRTLSYTAKLAAALVSSEETVLKLETVSGQLSACRTVLRLFDDIPMLNYTLSYGLGKEEPDRLSRIIGVLTNAADQLYFPLEHMAWACDHKLVSLRSTPWWTSSITCWTVSLYLSLAKALRCLRILQQHMSCLKDSDRDVNSVIMTNLLAEQRHQVLTAFRCVSDLAQAIHYLPEGFLWAGKLEKWHIGVLGTVSSIISLYQTYQRLIIQRKSK